MKHFILSIVLLITLAFLNAFAQDREFFRAKLGKPSEMYHLKSGVDVEVSYGTDDRACGITIRDSSKQRTIESLEKVEAVANELLAGLDRGKALGTTSNIGNCINVMFDDYEKVRVVRDRNACYEQAVGVGIAFKRNACPKMAELKGVFPGAPGKSNNSFNQSVNSSDVIRKT